MAVFIPYQYELKICMEWIVKTDEALIKNYTWVRYTKLRAFIMIYHFGEFCYCMLPSYLVVATNISSSGMIEK
jgi:hypothetical protein